MVIWAWDHRRIAYGGVLEIFHLEAGAGYPGDTSAAFGCECKRCELSGWGPGGRPFNRVVQEARGRRSQLFPHVSGQSVFKDARENSARD